MTFQTKTFDASVVGPVSLPTARSSALDVPSSYRRFFIWFQLIVAYVLMEHALWSSRLAFRNTWVFVAAFAILLFVMVDRPSLQQMGLGLPTTFGASMMLAMSFATVVVMIFATRLAGGQIPANPMWPSLHLAWEYVAWALIQEFMLQSFFFTRCEELWGSSSAVWIAAILFSGAHLPNPILTALTFVGGLFFCGMFRRYRSIYPIGVVHALLGLTLALTVPNSLLHQMRVGIGYLRH
jgi:membrane protease YdiL (CAAX protease family)